MILNEYTNEFYRLDIRYEHVDNEVDKVTRYINGLRFRIQDEISLIKLKSVEEAYQYTLNAKEILKSKHEKR